jgi:hypothetical protein
MSFGGVAELYFMADERVAPPGAPTDGYATPPTHAPTSWPSGFSSSGGRSGNAAPVTGELSSHAKAALKRMGITP